jgi:hypothetical protein
MKIYEKNTPNRKSWAIKLHDATKGIVNLCAVDSITGETICTLIRFAGDGRILVIPGSMDRLAFKGYNFLEHGNTWDENFHSIEIDRADMT